MYTSALIWPILRTEMVAENFDARIPTHFSHSEVFLKVLHIISAHLALGSWLLALGSLICKSWLLVELQPQLSLLCKGQEVVTIALCSWTMQAVITGLDHRNSFSRVSFLFFQTLSICSLYASHMLCNLSRLQLADLTLQISSSAAPSVVALLQMRYIVGLLNALQGRFQVPSSLIRFARKPFQCFVAKKRQPFPECKSQH